MSQELNLFVREALLKGQSRAEIRKVLKSAKWGEDEVSRALDGFADVAFPVPVPKRRPYLSAREAFMYLLTFLTLYISAISFGTMLFQFINRWLPDIVPYGQYYDGTVEAIRWSASALLIAYPLFLTMSWLLRREILRDPDKRASKIRKWLTYITLFVAAGVIIGDLITLVFNMLGGELTLRFILKVLTVGGIAGVIFGYYLWDLRKEEKS